MKLLSDKELKAIKEYSDWLTKEQKRLGFTKEELAEAIGKSSKTVSRYMSGENNKIPSSEIRDKIAQYFESLEKYNGYERRPPLEFGNILLELMTELHISEIQLANRLCKDQRTVSDYINGKKNLNAADQYEILLCLYDMVKFEHGMPDELSLGIIKLKRLLFGEEEQITEDFYEEDVIDHTKLIDYFDSLSFDLQTQIIKHYKAFFEQTEEQMENGVTVMLSTYGRREDMMREFRCMTESERSKMVYDIEQNAIMTFPDPDDSEEVSYFAAVAEMRTIVTDNEYYEALSAAEESPNYYKSERNRLSFSRLIYRHGIIPEAID